MKPEIGLEQRRFAGAIRSDQTEDLVAIEIERNLVDGAQTRRTSARLAHPEQGRAHFGLRSTRRTTDPIGSAQAASPE